jgi:hypothetical protein
MTFDWSTNPIKLARARGNIGTGASEEEIRNEYVRIGGFIPLSYGASKTPSASSDTVRVVISESETLVEKPKRAPKKKSVVKRVVKKKKK